MVFQGNRSQELQAIAWSSVHQQEDLLGGIATG